MSIAGWFSKLFSRERPHEADPEKLRDYTLRRWEAADTDRLNQSHWQGVRGQSINADLLADLETIRTRCNYEIANNPIVEGMIATHTTDVVGPNGPALKVLSDSEAYNEAVLAGWQQWFAAPTTNPNIAGPDMLRVWIRSLWPNGEFLGQFVTGRNAMGPVKMRVKLINTRRLATPPMMAGNPNVVMGVEVTHDGEPTWYHVRDPKRMGAYELDTGNYKRLSPDDVIHGFQPVEEDQVRGVPWLAPVLPVIANMRAYDQYVLDAAKAAAANGVLLHTDHPDAEYLEVNDSTEIEPGTISTVPPGWQVSQLDPKQPSTQYVEFRRERLADMGRPVCMPLMMVRLCSEDHNYSSARFDAQLYLRSLQALQGWLERHTMNRLVREVVRELRFSLPPAPAKVTYDWTWPVLPHVDPKKEAEGERMRMENGTLPWDNAIASHGLDPEATKKKLQKDAEEREKIKLPKFGKASGRPRDDDEDDEEETSKKSDKKKETADA